MKIKNRGQNKSLNRKHKKVSFEEISKIYKKLTSPTFKGGYIFALLTFFIIIILTANIGLRYDLKVGDISPFTKMAPYSFEVPDYEKWERKKEEAVEAVPDQYSYNRDALIKSINDIENLFINLIITSNRNDLSFEEKINHFTSNYNKGFSNERISQLLNFNEEQLKNLLTKSKAATKEIMEEEIKPRELDYYKKEKVKDALIGVELSEDEKEIVIEVVGRFIRSTAVYDDEKTEIAKEKAREDVSLIKIPVKANQKIVEEGYPLTQEDILILKYLGLIGRSLTWKEILGTSFLVLTSILSFAVYIYKFHLNDYFNLKDVTLLSLIILIFTIIIRIFSQFISQLDIGGSSSWWGYLIPISAASMIVTMLFNSNLGIMTILVLTIFNGILTTGVFNFILVGLIGGIFTVYLVSKVSQRQQIIRAGVFLAFLIGLLVFIINITSVDIRQAFIYSLIGFANGLICTIITLGTVPFIENLFNVTTPMRLLELSNPDHPLLKRLIKNAPGTYNHSLLVANLSEYAAETIGANALLVRVASYYHDIGKLRRPSAFIENRGNQESIHEELKPSLSKLLIENHVKDGISMARRAKLPEEIIDAIAQHHGTSVITYFYNKQKKLEEGSVKEKTTEQVFRYQGEKPKSKETAIVMLADAVQAKGKTLKNPTSSSVKKMIKDIINERLEDGQLDESDLTLKEIQTIADSFHRTLIQGVYHPRIDYPEKESDIEKEESIKKKKEQIKRKYKLADMKRKSANKNKEYINSKNELKNNKKEPSNS